MFQYGILAGGLKVEHQHADGSWETMDPEEVLNPAEFDPERDWSRGHVFVCRTCEETVRITPQGSKDEAGDRVEAG
jgi:hypothetical protein